MIQTRINTSLITVVKAALINFFGTSHQRNVSKTPAQLIFFRIKNTGGSETTHVSKNVRFNITFNKSMN